MSDVPTESVDDTVPIFTFLPSEQWDDSYLSALEDRLKQYDSFLAKGRKIVLECDEDDVPYNSQQLIQCQHTHLAVEREIGEVRSKLYPDEKK